MKICKSWMIGLAKPILRLHERFDSRNLYRGYVQPQLQICFWWSVSKKTPWRKILNMQLFVQVVVEEVGISELFATLEELEDLRANRRIV